jgi:hypothetical protein
MNPHLKSISSILIISFLLLSIRTEDCSLDEQENQEYPDFDKMESENKFTILLQNSSDSSLSSEHLFRIYSNKNYDEEAKKQIENEFYFDIDAPDYENVNVEIDDYENKDNNNNFRDVTSNPDEIENYEINMTGNLITTIKMNNNFHSVEVSLENNGCLSFFMYFDTQKETNVTKIPKKYNDPETTKCNHLFKFDFTKNSHNQFNSSAESYLGNNGEDSDFLYNLISQEDHEIIYLKMICPYYKSDTDNSIDIKFSTKKHFLRKGKKIF